MEIKKEVEIIEHIEEKLKEKFPNLLKLAGEEFLDFYGEEILKSEHKGHIFYGWLFNIFTLHDGKNIPNLCFEVLDLNEEEKKILRNIKYAVNGFFEVLDVKGNEIVLKDLLTQKEYKVRIIDLKPLPKKGACLDACLVKNFDEDYFFFGGFYSDHNKKYIKLKLLEYTRDLTFEEIAEIESDTIKNLEIEDKDSLKDYLSNVLEMDEIEDFLKLDDSGRKKFLKERMGEIEKENERI